jgi:hypothetical protein
MLVAIRRGGAVATAVVSVLLVASVLASGVFAGRGTFGAFAALYSGTASSSSALAAGPAFALSSTAVGCAGPNSVVGASCFAPQVQFTWTEKGTGSYATYTGGATLWALFECVNNGTNLPQAANKSSIGSATTTKSFDADKGGKIVVGPGAFIVPAAPVDLSTVGAPAGFSCPNTNYTLRVSFDHYEGLYLTDTSTGAVATGLPARLP